jgi:hypothetical protein
VRVRFHHERGQPAQEGRAQAAEPVYEVVGGVKTNSAAHLGGRVVVGESCGGLHQAWESPAPEPISFFLGRLRGSMFSRP